MKSISEVRLPTVPGVYTAEVWLEDSEGAQGAPAATQLRYDNARPGSAAPRPAPDWIGRSAFPFTVRIDHPQDPIPASGIRGYALSIDRDQLGAPCSDSFLCDPAEIDLGGGIEHDSVQIPELPEGISLRARSRRLGVRCAVRARRPDRASGRYDRSIDSHRGRSSRLDEPAQSTSPRAQPTPIPAWGTAPVPSRRYRSTTVLP